MSQPKPLVILGGIASLVVILAAIGFFENPDMFPSKFGASDNYCSPIQNQYDSFILKFSNWGDENGKVCVNVTSDGLNFEQPTKCLIFPPDRVSYAFEFDFVDDSFPELNYYEEGNFTINYTWSYKKYIFLPTRTKSSCFYKKSENSVGGTFYPI